MKTEEMAFANGLLKMHNGQIVATSIAPAPTRIEKRVLERMQHINKIVSRLYFSAANDAEYLAHLAQETDCAFVHVLDRIRQKEPEKVFGAFIRTDYILDRHSTPKQVETNAISVCFVSYGPRVNALHKTMYKDRNIVQSSSDEDFVHFALQVRREYAQKTHAASEDALLFVMLDEHNNAEVANYMEKLQMLFSLEKAHIRTAYLSLEEADAQLSCVHGKLYCKNTEVYCVYFRTLYCSETLFAYERLRTDIEMSQAVAVPNAATLMCASKTSQMLLGTDKWLRKYLSEDDTAELQTALQPFSHVDAFATEAEDGTEWILKSNREGGGHCVFGKDIHTKIAEIQKSNTSRQYLLMKRIDERCELKNNEKWIAEIGLFGSIVSGQHVSIENAGYIVRSKHFYSSEGGVCIGTGYLDSIETD